MGDWADVKVGIRLAFAHHPLCHVYREDVFRVAGVKVCSGCAVMWPVFALTLPSAWFVTLIRPDLAVAVFIVGAAVSSVQFASYGVRHGRLFRAGVKATAGFGLAAAIAGWAAFPLALGWRILGFAFMLLVLIGLQALRMQAIVSTCKACPWNMAWDSCPGFRDNAPALPPRLAQPPPSA